MIKIGLKEERNWLKEKYGWDLGRTIDGSRNPHQLPDKASIHIVDSNLPSDFDFKRDLKQLEQLFPKNQPTDYPHHFTSYEIKFSELPNTWILSRSEEWWDRNSCGSRRKGGLVRQVGSQIWTRDMCTDVCYILNRLYQKEITWGLTTMDVLDYFSSNPAMVNESLVRVKGLFDKDGLREFYSSKRCKPGKRLKIKPATLAEYKEDPKIMEKLGFYLSNYSDVSRYDFFNGF